MTSAHLLNLLRTKFNFVGHLAALKRYLLLGQGDFIHQLMLDIQYVEWGGVALVAQAKVEMSCLGNDTVEGPNGDDGVYTCVSCGRHYIIHVLHFRADLSRPGQQLYQHTLAAYLESAVRTTSAQHDDKEILERLDVRCLEVRI